jgi:peroxin-5
MAGFAKDLMGGQGCSVDGLAQARNPMGQFVDAMFQGPQGMKGQMMGPRGPMSGPGASMHAAMKQGFSGPQARGPMARGPANWGGDFQRMGGGGGGANWGQSFQARGPRMRMGGQANWGQNFQRAGPKSRAPVMRRGSARGPMGRGPMMGNPMMMGGMGMNPMMMQPMMMQPMMGGPMMQQPMVQNAGPTFQQVSDNGKVAAKEETTVVEEQPIVQEDVTKAEEILQDTLDGKSLDDIWSNAMTEANSLAAAWQDVATREYVFVEDNPYKEGKDTFAEGMRLFNEGEIDEAILAFQAFVQENTEDSSEGWRMLGLSHQEHDQDREAIGCLERAVEQDPYNLEALLALGVSYVNELDSQRALANLKKWVEHHPKFQGMNVIADAYSDGTLMDEVMQLMLSAMKVDATDPDVQIVLGVLYNVSRDYDSAVQAFRQALNTRPDDYSLWNKLGATQANGSRSEQALPAYLRALELKPKYARGWLNMGISHANLGNYPKAARAYLKALRLNPKATHVWSYLRIAFTCMERFDLVKQVEQRNPDIFTEFQ